MLRLMFLAVPAHAVAGTADYHVGTGDVLQISVLGTELGGQFVVGSSGLVRFPYCERLELGGKTVPECEEALRTCLMDGVIVDPQVTVRVEEYRSLRVEVTGAVGKAGTVYLQGTTTLRALLGMAGGVQAERSNGTVTVVRGDGRFTVALPELGGDAGSMEIEPGDVVSVDQGFVVLVDGVGVSKPGALPFVDGMTVSQALARAGGATQVANLAASYVLRDGEKISVNLRKIRNGKAADFALLPGDELVVPESPI